MTQEIINMFLYRYCTSIYYQGLKELLNDYRSNIDLLHDEGRVLHFAISHDSVELLNILLSFYIETKLNKDPKSKEYMISYGILRNILETAIESFEITPEIHEIIAPYLVKQEESDNDQDLTGFDFEEENLKNPADNISKMHRSNSAPNLSNYTKFNSLLYSSSESLFSSIDSTESMPYIGDINPPIIDSELV